VFAQMSRSLGRLSKGAAAKDVHHFRTNSRRTEALISEMAPDTRNRKKLLKALFRLRKRAGKVRDLDVQIEFMKNFKIADRQDHRAQFLEGLNSEQARRSRKLLKAFDAATVKELRKRLRRAQSELKLDGIDPVRLAVDRLPKPGELSVDEQTLHRNRVAGKQARYLAELGGDSPDARFVVEELKRAQDVIGQWHDVLKLKEAAERRFGSVRDSALVSALQNISRAKFRRAASALIAATTAISERRKTSIPEQAPRKEIVTGSVKSREAAA
jgi:CHAD domain-containing protein